MASLPVGLLAKPPGCRRRGRPKGTAPTDLREKLLRTALELFRRYGYRAVSSRQISTAAGVNSALIRYYFGGRQGLYREILRAVLRPACGAIESALAGGRAAPLFELLEYMTRTLAADPWIAGFVVREVLAPGGAMREMVLREIPESYAWIAERAIGAASQRGAVRPGIDGSLLLLSVVSLAAFPFLAHPVTSRTLGVRHDDEFVNRFLRHTTELLMHGVSPAWARTDPSPARVCATG